MLKTYVTHADLLKFEPRVDDYLASDQDDFTDIIASAKEILTQDLKSNKLELKKLCTPLELQATVAATTSNAGTKVEDEIERRFLVITVTAISGTATFTVLGTNSSSTEPDQAVLTKVITATGTYTELFDNVYKYYTIDYAGTTCTYKAELVEESFYLAHVYMSLNRVYQQMRHRVGSTWESKADYYMQLYEVMMKNIVHSYDEDLSGDVDKEETSNIRVTFHR